MHGEKREDAAQSSDFSADHIYRLIQDSESYKSDTLVFMDIHGKPMPW
jgi:hypothetical protein